MIWPVGFSLILVKCVVSIAYFFDQTSFQIDSSARTMRYKSWPHYNDWCQIYGNDPIIREITEDLSDTDQKINTDLGKKEKEMALEFDCCINEVLDDENEVSVILCVVLKKVRQKRSKCQGRGSFQIIVMMIH